MGSIAAQERVVKNLQPQLAHALEDLKVQKDETASAQRIAELEERLLLDMDNGIDNAEMWVPYDQMQARHDWYDGVLERGESLAERAARNIQEKNAGTYEAIGNQMEWLLQEVKQFLINEKLSGPDNQRGAIIRFDVSKSGKYAADGWQELPLSYVAWSEAHNIPIQVVTGSLHDPSSTEVGLQFSEGTYGLLAPEHGTHKIKIAKRKGRPITNDVRVRVYPTSSEKEEWSLDQADVDIRTTRSGGPGGQHKDKNDTAVYMKDRKTGIRAQASDRSQYHNRKSAGSQLQQRVRAHYAKIEREQRAEGNMPPIGAIRRTYDLREGRVNDKPSRMKGNWQDFRKGEIMRYLLKPHGISFKF